MSRKSSIRKVKQESLKSGDIESALCMHLYEKRHSPITTRFKGMGLQECDVVSVSSSGYIYEYEIKISRGDFRKDFIKEKHEYMAEGKSTRMRKGEVQYLSPSYFSFVVPEGLVQPDEVPEYAGLIYMSERGTFEVVKKAPLLHKEKATDKFVRQLAHNLTCKLVFRKMS